MRTKRWLRAVVVALVAGSGLFASGAGALAASPALKQCVPVHNRQACAAVTFQDSVLHNHRPLKVPR